MGQKRELDISATTQLKYRPEIDGLRAVAIMPVVLFHAGFALFSGGFVGVDIFFVISGYLITSIIVQEINDGTFSILNFYERRIRRILPPLFIVISVSIFLGWWFLFPSEIFDLTLSAISVIFFVSNFYFWQKQDYFGTSAELQPLLHTWSLAVEEQFYLVFPILLLSVYKVGRHAIKAILILLILISFSLTQISAIGTSTANFYLLPTRAWELLLGALCAILMIRGNFDGLPRLIGKVLSIAGIGLILLSVFFFNATTPNPGFPTLLPTIGTSLVILFVNSSSILLRFLSNRFLVGIGLISYSIYLWHQPVFAFARLTTTEELPLFHTWSLILLVIILSFASWASIEKPFRNKKNFNRKMIFQFAGVSFLLLTVIAVGINGFSSSRLSFEQNQVLSTMQTSPKREQCHLAQQESALQRKACSYFLSPTKVAVIGNSHAVELSYALASELRSEGIGLTQYSMSGCNHNYRIASEMQSVCGRWHTKVVGEISSQNDIETVVISYRNDYYLNKSEYRRALIKLIQDLQSAGKDVILVLQSPSLPVHVNNYLRSSPTGDFTNVQALSTETWQEQYKYASRLLRKLPEGATVVDPVEDFCNARNCFAIRDGAALFFDDHHMSLSGSRLIAKRIIRLL